MDFDKIKPAVDEIALDDIQKAQILNACKNKKRKFNYKPLVGIAAAVAITVALFSPGFFFRASKSSENENMAADSAENGKGSYELYADQDIAVNDSLTTSADIPLFEAEGFYELYSIVPYEFSSLVSEKEYNIWKANVTADGGMAMAQFVLDFNISREDFEAANKLYNERTFINASDSAAYFDADVIYSFDREQIDSFYKK